MSIFQLFFLKELDWSLDAQAKIGMEYEPLPFGRLLPGTGYIFNCRGRGVQDCLVATVYVGFYHCNQDQSRRFFGQIPML